MSDQNNAEKMRGIFGELILKCWNDVSFKESFKKDPKKYLAEAGVEVPENMKFIVLEQTDKISYMVLPEEIDMQTVQKTMLELINKTAQKEFKLPENGELRIVQNTKTMQYILIPSKPENIELDDTQLDKVSGGYGGVVVVGVIYSSINTPVVVMGPSPVTGFAPVSIGGPGYGPGRPTVVVAG